MISSTTGAKFRILSVQSASSDLRIETTTAAAEPASKQVVHLNVPRPSDVQLRLNDRPRRFLSGAIQVQTSDKLQPIVVIPWSAVVERSLNLPADARQPETNVGPGHS